MEDELRSRQELIEELQALRYRVVELQLPDGDASAQQVRDLLDQIPAIVWTVSLDMRLTWWRGGGIRILGLDEVAQLGVTVTDFYHTTNPEHPAVHAHRAALEGEARNFEVLVDADGQNRWLRAHVEPLRGPDETIRGVIGVALDITERVRAQVEREELIRELQDALDRVKALSGLIPICSHCKAVRNDKGYWQQVDAFMREHSNAQLTHAICPDCSQRLLLDVR